MTDEKMGEMMMGRWMMNSQRFLDDVGGYHVLEPLQTSTNATRD